jgi:hypothetical protein
MVCFSAGDRRGYDSVVSIRGSDGRAVSGGLALGGFSGGAGLGIGLGSLSGAITHSGGPIQAAVFSSHSIEVIPVNILQQPIQPQVIYIDSGELPVLLNFNSRSSRVLVQQTHIPGAPGETQVSQSEDEPHRLVHEVMRPVIQEVREVITPYRQVVQEIRPVVEEVHTVVAKGEGRAIAGGYGGGYGAGYGAGYGRTSYGVSSGQLLSGVGIGGAVSGSYGLGIGGSRVLSSGAVKGGLTAAKVVGSGPVSYGSVDGLNAVTKEYKS